MKEEDLEFIWSQIDRLENEIRRLETKVFLIDIAKIISIMILFLMIILKCH
jgi:hypothetical protein